MREMKVEMREVTMTSVKNASGESSMQPTLLLNLLTVFSMENVMIAAMMTVAIAELASTKANTVHYFGRDKSLVLSLNISENKLLS